MAKRRRSKSKKRRSGRSGCAKTEAVKRGCGRGWKPNKSRTKCIRDR